MKYNRRKKMQDATKRIAEERIEILLSLAEQNFKTNPDRSKRYIKLAGLIGMRYSVRLKRAQKRKICKHCRTLLIPGKNCRIRLKNSVILTTCETCGKMSRYPYYKKQDKADENETDESGKRNKNAPRPNSENAI